MRLITFLFSLLLAVGWTNVSAQLLPTANSFLPQMDFTGTSGISISQGDTKVNAPMREDAAHRPMVSLTKDQAEAITYTWYDAEHNAHPDTKATGEISDPYQIYAFLKFVYMDKRFPGPYTTAYTSTGQRENPTYYGGVDGGWNIPYTANDAANFSTRTVPLGDFYSIGIAVAPTTIDIKSITVYNAQTNATLTSWNANNASANYYGNYEDPDYWDIGDYWGAYFQRKGSYNNYYGQFAAGEYGGGIINIYANALGSAKRFKVVINARNNGTAGEDYIMVNGETKNITNSSFTDYTWTFTEKTITEGAAYTPTDVVISTLGNDLISSIDIKGMTTNTTISWSSSTNLPDGWFKNNTLTRSSYYYDSDGNYGYYMNGGGVIRVPSDLFRGEKGVTVTVKARAGADPNTAGILFDLCHGYEHIYLENNFKTYTANLYFPVERDSNYYKPNQEGYTAILVSVRDTVDLVPMILTPTGIDRCNFFTDSTQLIDFFRKNIKFVKLLTDGIRVGDGENIGTVFRCDGTYNKFFFLGKGRARRKDNGVLGSIANSNSGLWPDWSCEQVPFHYMYEQFSPTQSDIGDDIEDFYTEMMDGKLYDIIHDCPSVIENEHQFSMSGKNGTTAYGMTGMNFYIPDYRLKYFTLDPGDPQQPSVPVKVDGRDMNPYLIGDDNAHTGVPYRQADHVGVLYARYNPDHAPKVGIYKITLDASVAPVEGYDIDTNPNYQVTLDWVSSLDQMSGNHYPQHYNIYQIVVDAEGNEKLVKVAEVDHDDENDFNHYNIYSIIVDENGNETRGEKIGQGNVTTDDPTFLTLPTKYLQGDYSQTYTFIIEGWPMNSDRRPTFFAWSNPDQVIIPGKSQFLSLHLDHYESDFIINGASDLAYMKNYRNSLITKPITGEHNYYRNFVSVNSEDVMHGLTIDSINKGMHTFDMLRSTLIPKEEGELKIAQIVFDHPVATNAKEVGYTITYVDNTQFLLANKFIRDSLQIPATGTVRIKGNGDLVIQPSGYNVNFYSINVTRGNQTWSWTYTQTTGLNAQTKLPTGWYLTPGSMWVQDHANNPYYLEGGGYIAIPNVINGTQDVTVTIKASGDLSTHSNILVDDRIWNITNGDAVEHTWNIPASSSQTPTLNYYEKITSVDQITSGSKYLIVCEGRNPSRVLNGSIATNQFNTTSNSGDITISGDNKITTEQGDMFYFTITALNNGRYSIRSNSGNYIGDTGNSSNTDNMSASTNTALANSITFDANGNAIIRNQNNTSQLRETQFNSDGTLYRYFSYFGNQASAYGYSQPIQLYKYVETSAPAQDYGLLRIGALHFVDQFKAPTDKDKHPYRYGYQLKEVVSDDGNGNVVYGKASGMVEVPVQHTGSKVNGYFTLDSIDNDIYIKADTNLMTADIVTELSATNSMVFFNTIQARRKQNPVVFRQYATILQQQTDFTYKEMKDPSDRYGKIYDPGIHHYFDSLKLTGKYNVDTCKRVYIPSVMTRGIDRRYFTDDTLHNTYGAPIYRTGVGKVELNSATAVLMQDQYGSVTWQDENDITCNLFCLQNIKATGYLPSNSVSNVDYEPYMFRLYVKSPNGKLRPYTQGENGQAVSVDIDPNDTTMTHGPLCVWSGYVCNNIIPESTSYSDYGEMYGKELINHNVQDPNNKDYKYIYEKKMVERAQGSSWDKQKYNAFFGAVKDIIYTTDDQGKPVMKNQIDPNDLTIYVRFYYIGEGLAEGHTPHIEHSNVPDAQASANAPRRDGEAPSNGYTGPSGYANDSQGVPPGIATAVNEILFHGEIVKTTYYNLQGMESSKPFDGLNIVVNRYSDGTTQAFKVMY